MLPSSTPTTSVPTPVPSQGPTLTPTQSLQPSSVPSSMPTGTTELLIPPVLVSFIINENNNNANDNNEIRQQVTSEELQNQLEGFVTRALQTRAIPDDAVYRNSELTSTVSYNAQSGAAVVVTSGQATYAGRSLPEQVDVTNQLVSYLEQLGPTDLTAYLFQQEGWTVSNIVIDVQGNLVVGDDANPTRGNVQNNNNNDDRNRTILIAGIVVGGVVVVVLAGLLLRRRRWDQADDLAASRAITDPDIVENPKTSFAAPDASPPPNDDGALGIVLPAALTKPVQNEDVSVVESAVTDDLQSYAGLVSLEDKAVFQSVPTLGNLGLSSTTAVDTPSDEEGLAPTAPAAADPQYDASRLDRVIQSARVRSNQSAESFDQQYHA